MKLPDDEKEPDKFSPIILAVIFVIAIVILVLWINKDSLVRKNNGDYGMSSPSNFEESSTYVPPSTLSPDDFDFWEKYPAITPNPTMEPTPEPQKDPSTDGKHTKIMNEEGEEEWIEINPNLERHSYDFSGLIKQSEMMKYYHTDRLSSYLGVDISKYQGYVDFIKVKKAGVDFCILRVGARGYGTGQLLLDSYFQENIKRASDAGLEIGVYFFSQAITVEEAVEEANMVLEQIAGYEVKYPVVFDMEYIENGTARVEQLDVNQKTEIARAFLDTVESKGYTPMLYGKKEWLLTRVDLEKLERYDIWLSQYEDVPDYPYQFTMWQYTDMGKVDGISGKVDMNISFIDYSEK